MKLPLDAHGAVAQPKRRGELAAADWRFLLPRMCYRSALHVGAPSITLLPLLAGMAETLTIVSPDRVALANLRAAAAAAGSGNVRLVRADGTRPLAPRRFDLVLHANARLDPFRSADWLGDIDRLLGADGVAYVETGGFMDAARLRRQLRAFALFGFREPGILWLARRKGMLRLALPLGTADIGRHCLDQLVVGVTRTGRSLRQLARVLARARVLEHIHPRRGVLLERVNGTSERVLPAAYLLDAVREAGVPTADMQIAFFAGADQNANKVALLVFEGSTPRILVKMPRSAAYNERLEREHRTLMQLRESGAAASGTYPEPLFLRYHGGLALAGQSVLRGSPFRRVTSCTAECAHARAAVDWITALGERSAPERVPARALAYRFRRMLEWLVATFPFTESEREFLSAQAGALEQSRMDVPLVFRHGDATPWNILVGDHGGPGVIDWEHGEPRGLPLWDLFTFLQGYALWAGRVRGAHDDAAGFAAAFLRSTPFSRLSADATAAYCARVGVDRSLVEPLFYTCWMQRVARSPERVRVPPESTPFFRVLRLAIRERCAPGLACMLD